MKKFAVVLALAILVSIAVPMGLLTPLYAAPLQHTFNSTSSDGSLGCEKTDYAQAHGYASGIVYDSQRYFDVGQWKVGGSYAIMRAGLFFDTSTIPDNALITEATLLIYGFGDHSDVDFEICIVSGDDLDDPMVSADYHDLLDATTIMGSMNTQDWTTQGYNNITIDPSWLDEINKTGTTKFALRSDRDINSIAPTGVEYVEFYMSEQEGTDKDPKLVVTYDTAPAAAGSNLPWIIGVVAAAVVVAGILVVMLRRRAQQP